MNSKITTRFALLLAFVLPVLFGAQVVLGPGAILERLKLVDGAASGLDADLLDGTAPTSAGLAILDDADSAAQRSTLELGSIATENAPLTIVSGGTGATTAQNARNNLGLSTMATQSAGNVDITGGAVDGLTSLTNLLTPLAVSSGGTGGTTAGTARQNLGVERRTLQLHVFGRLTANVTGETSVAALVPHHLDGGTITRVVARVNTAGVGGSQTIQIDNNGQNLLSTALTLTTGTSDDTTSGTGAIDTNNHGVTGGTYLRPDITAVHSTTVAKGLDILIEVTK